jgi:hypothetical protein
VFRQTGTRGAHHIIGANPSTKNPLALAQLAPKNFKPLGLDHGKEYSPLLSALAN